MKIATLDIVADIGDVRRPCDIALKKPYHKPGISMKNQHRQRLPDRQVFNVWRSEEVKQ